MRLRDLFCAPTRMRETTPIIRPTSPSSPRPRRADTGRFFGPVGPRGTDRNRLSRHRHEPSPASQYRLPTPPARGTYKRNVFSRDCRALALPFGFGKRSIHHLLN
jgi:hypothetical protein